MVVTTSDHGKLIKNNLGRYYLNNLLRPRNPSLKLPLQFQAVRGWGGGFLLPETEKFCNGITFRHLKRVNTNLYHSHVYIFIYIFSYLYIYLFIMPLNSTYRSSVSNKLAV